MKRVATTLAGALVLIVLLVSLRGGEVHAAPPTLTVRARLPLLARDAAVAPPWLDLVNSYRRMAKVPDLTENPAWSDGAYFHSRYMAENNVIGHLENPSLPYYTVEGDISAHNSNVYLGFGAATERTAIEGWVTGPFHGVGLLDPQLEQTGFGFYRTGDRWAATLDVIHGLQFNSPRATGYPYTFPADGAVVPLTSYTGNETPDPLTACAGYKAPTGLPIYLLLGSGSITPNVTAHSLTSGGVAIEHCTYSETNYTNPDASTQDLGRAVLGSRDAIVIIPRQPLARGVSYTVSVTANGVTTTWSFTVSATAADN